ncbi:MAG TPA: DUF5691 domain-containing protein [Isosphaeraceae bacterium]|nr:DUF5691 domain-containing protein [Isosphaeraceae bacterium]
MNELAKIALVGTSKYAGPLPATEHLAVALGGLEDEDRERSLLLRCGANAVYRLAGQRAIAGIEPTVPAPPETKRTASPGVSRLLQDAVTTGGNNLLIDLLRQMEARSIVLPPALLPLLLDSKDASVRRSLIPVLGERGAWLCRQNPDWSFFHPKADPQARVDLDELKHIWDEGLIDQRIVALAVLRRHDPLSARDWVAQVWAKEKAPVRVRLVESLETGLCRDDEVFLESCLNDRSSAVAQSAARLLCRLPQSALAGRMRARAAAILGIERTGLIYKAIKLVCTPPQQIDRDWERDGILKQAPPGVGERAFWTERVLAAVPPSHWQSQFGLGPQQLMGAVADEPFAEPIVAGWSEAAVSFAASDPASADWLMPLWTHLAQGFGALKDADRPSALMKMQALLAAMTRDAAEAAIANLIHLPAGWNDVDVLNCVTALRPPWSAHYSAAVLAAARRRIQSRASEAAYRWANMLATNACEIHVDAFPLALVPWEMATAEERVSWFAANIESDLNKFVTTIEMRTRFMSELNA